MVLALAPCACVETTTVTSYLLPEMFSNREMASWIKTSTYTLSMKWLGCRQNRSAFDLLITKESTGKLNKLT